MSVSNDPDNFFQTTASLEAQQRRRLRAGNKNGNPITLPSKVLTFTLHPVSFSHILFTGESGGLARRVNFVTGETNHTFRGHAGPVTAVVVQTTTLYTGSWDRTIKVWNVETRECLFTLTGHTDFVKSLLFLPAMSLLLSGSTDASLRVWSADSRSKEPTLLHTLKGHSRAIEDIAVDYSMSNKDNSVVYTASSDRTIRKWDISRDRASEDGEPLVIHDTSVYTVKVDQDDIWTCSADKTAKRYDRINRSQEVFQHPDFVKDIVVSGGLVYTACSDENIRQWSLDTMKVSAIFEGHFDEITQLEIVGTTLISASLDSTIRLWNTLEPPPKLTIKKEEPKKDEGMLTEEEERELAELMFDEEGD